MADTADTLVSILRETVPGTTPTATPPWKWLDVTDCTINTDVANQIRSDVIKNNRAASDTVMAGYSVAGSLSGELRRDTSLDTLMESGLGNTFATTTLIGGSKNLYQTFEQQMITSAGSKIFYAYAGCQVSKFGVAVDAQSKATWSADIVGMSQTERTGIMTGAQYTAATQGKMLDGVGTGSITIAGLSAVYYSIDLQVTSTRSPKFGLFQNKAFGIATPGARETVLTIQGYRDDINPESVFLANTPIPVSFSLGSGAGNIYTFNLPRCFASPLKRETSDGSEMWSIELIAASDPTLNSDISIVRS